MFALIVHILGDYEGSKVHNIYRVKANLSYGPISRTHAL